MPDLNKAIKGLEMHEKKRAGVGCLECPYAEAEGATDDWCIRGLHRDILAILKEQEAVKPRVSTAEQRCGHCNKVIEMDGWKACPWCGKPILWEAVGRKVK